MTNPIVKLRPVREAGRITAHVVWCETGDCEYVLVEQLKSSAQSGQRKHAMRHRTERNRTARKAAQP